MRSYNYQITPKRITEMAQEIHNDIDENGDMSCEEIVEELAEELGAGLKAWIEENIDWAEIAYDDMEVRADHHEYITNQVRGWATA